jgi:TolB-like protein/DNA-binding winged helix-turn-helix (wHTH) protein/tetratricopeptide (TPR) repeat protein
VTTVNQGIVRFGTFEFDLDSGELRTGGRKVRLQGQPAQVLARFLTRPGQLVTREELRRTIWADDTFVDFDAALNVAVNKLRQALGDSASQPRFIETVPKRGYRFLADVHPIEMPPSAVHATVQAPIETTGSPLIGRRWILGAGLMLVIIAVWSGVSGSPRSPSPRSVAVLPFRPLVVTTPPDSGLELGLAEAVIVRLGRLKQLRVPSIHAVQTYSKLESDPLAAGRTLGVDAVLDGSLQRLNGTLRLSARLIDVRSGTALWAQQWDFPWTDIFSVQDAMATEITHALALRLAPAELSTLRQHPTNVAAYDSYLRARALLLRRTRTDSARAAELLEEAVKQDPKSAAAYASLAFAYVSIPLMEGPSTPYVELARRAARRALDLDPAKGDAHAVMARILVHFDWDLDGSERAARYAFEVDPTDPFVLHCVGAMHADRGRFDEALKLADIAVSLDPASVLANQDKARSLFIARRYEEAIQQSHRTLELDRYNATAYWVLARAYERLNRPKDALEASIAPLAFREDNREMVAALRRGADQGGLKAYWALRVRYMLQEPQVRSASLAFAYLSSGDHDNAMKWLEKHYDERGALIPLLQAYPQWDALRADPRFQALLSRANLPSLTPSPRSLALGRALDH